MSAVEMHHRSDWKTTVIGVAVLFLAAIGGLFALGAIMQARQTPEQAAAIEARAVAEQAAVAKQAEACAADAECATEGIKLDAMAACTRPVERLASYRAEWIGGMTPKFAARDWRNSEKNVVVLSGAGIKFQNGFGAWQRYGYQCEYDIGKKAVVGVRAFPYSG